MEMKIRNATLEDAVELTRVESINFPAIEAAKLDTMKCRLNYYPNHFFVMENSQGGIVGFINGMVTNMKDLMDGMYTNAAMHDEKGEWQMILGLSILPGYRGNGYSKRLFNSMIEAAKQEHRKGVVLTCKEELVAYYEKLGFKDEGKSNSKHGGVEQWHQMRLTF